MTLLNVFAILGVAMYFIYQITVFKFATKILDNPMNNIVVITTIAFINSSALVIYSFLKFPHLFLYPILIVVLTIEFYIVSKSSFRQLIFGACVLTFHLSSMKILTIILFSYFSNIDPVSIVSSEELYLTVVFFTYVVLYLVLEIFKKFIPYEDIIKLSKTKIYSEFVTITAFLLTMYIAFDSYFLITESISIDQVLLSVSSTLFSAVVFYYLFLFASEFINLHVYKRKSDEAQVIFNSLVEKKKQIKNKIYTDDFTGIFNRVFAYEKLEKLLQNRKQSFGLIFIDLVALKYVNDNYSHEAGDRYIKRAVIAINSSIRETDSPARLGGDEFLIVLEELKQDDLPFIVDRIRENISLQDEIEEFLIDVSIGAIFVNEELKDLTVDSLLKLSDDLMREDKQKFYDKAKKV